MKIHLIIEIEDDGKTRRATVQRVAKVAELNGDGVLAINPAAALEIIKKQKRAKIADVAPPPIPPLPEPDAPKVRQSGSGPQFDPGFLKIIQDAPEPCRPTDCCGTSAPTPPVAMNRVEECRPR